MVRLALALLLPLLGGLGACAKSESAENAAKEMRTHPAPAPPRIDDDLNRSAPPRLDNESAPAAAH